MVKYRSYFKWAVFIVSGSKKLHVYTKHVQNFKQAWSIAYCMTETEGFFYNSVILSLIYLLFP